MPLPQAAISEFQKILGAHPGNDHPFGRSLIPIDGLTDSSIPCRNLSEKDGVRDDLVADLREMVTRHHASPEQLARSLAAKKRLGFAAAQKGLNRFPTNATTQKGNLAEVVLAEYLVASTESTLPVYRLRYNPNVDQSMKGDDVLAFDLDAQPVRIIVGEAKFRAKSSNDVVAEIVELFCRPNQENIPSSLQFIADRLFETGQDALGNRVMSCAELIATGNICMDYVGLLMSDQKSFHYIKKYSAISPLRRLALISLGMSLPESLNASCYDGLG